MEVTSWGAMGNIQPLVEDFVDLSPGFVIQTQVRAEQWEDVLQSDEKSPEGVYTQGHLA